MVLYTMAVARKRLSGNQMVNTKHKEATIVGVPR
jgi:hypothetical protein